MTCQLRTKLESAKTLKYPNASTALSYAAGQLTALGSTVGFFLEPVGTATCTPTRAGGTQPHGNQGVFVYEAEKALVDKATGTGQVCAVGDAVWYATNKINFNGYICAGICLESAGTLDDQVLIELKALGYAY